MAKQSLETKRQVYIFAFTFLGLLMGVVVYGLGSLIIIYKGYFLNFNWYLGILLAGGTIAGFMEGQRWWRIIYVEKAYLKWSKAKHETKLLGLALLIIFTLAIVFLARQY
ncbi:MAG: hypothetical protein KW788_00125 [Candidatus Doudnabacteria bacterium]|nr:hypothetical protein [Candidatus Doudnabacteria bacterium]